MRWTLPLLLLLGACAGPRHVLEPRGPNAGAISRMAIYSFWAAGVTFLLVILALVAVWRAGARRAARADADAIDPAADASATRRVVLALAAVTVVLFVYVGASVATGSAIAWPRGEPEPLVIEVTGKQWWWQVRYVTRDPSREVLTANEIHIPAGVRVRIVGSASDVIHSFWIPSLAGKQDLIPGYRTSFWIRADRPGAYGGQCAEFCGHQHAHMGLRVVAQPPADFRAWYEGQLASGAPPRTASERHGQAVFQQRTCAMCHRVAGTEAGSRVGPDLTHLATRGHIAAGTLTNTREHLARWITDPQSVKPGVRMPATQLSAADRDALLDYLQSLR
jgi:cytochrome c oxidase subunit II